MENHRQPSGRGTLPEAIKYFLENRPQKSPDITVREVVDQLLALKEKEGEVGQIYLRDLRVRLHKFAKSFQCPITGEPSGVNEGADFWGPAGGL